MNVIAGAFFVDRSSMPQPPNIPIEQIVKQLGRYPLDAFAFVQECIGAASERVHGPLSSDQRVVSQWMLQNEFGPEDVFERASEGDLPLDIAAALDRLGGVEEMNRHVTGQQLCWTIRDVALERWGLLARGVLAQWHITSTEDIGAIIFALVEHGWLQKQPTDSIEDFNHVFGFAEAFDKHYRIGSKSD